MHWNNCSDTHATLVSFPEILVKILMYGRGTVDCVEQSGSSSACCRPAIQPSWQLKPFSKDALLKQMLGPSTRAPGRYSSRLWPQPNPSEWMELGYNVDVSTLTEI
jgi:hypothetical protein